jgi:hypothetical protein
MPTSQASALAGRAGSLGSLPMANALGFTCSCCGEHHAELPMSYTAATPYVCDPSFADAPDLVLSRTSAT